MLIRRAELGQGPWAGLFHARRLNAPQHQEGGATGPFDKLLRVRTRFTESRAGPSQLEV